MNRAAPVRHAVDRRGFLKAAAAVGCASYVPSSAFGANDRVVTAHVGVGGQGRGNLGAFLRQQSARPALVCDVDSGHAAAAARSIEKAGGKPEIVADYRRILDRKDIDAVVVSTPDHWHALPTVHACQAGKHVYCEKPLTLRIAEGRAMVDAARAAGVVVQTGSQQRSSTIFRKACEYVRSGRLGKIEQVLVGIGGVNWKGEPVPDSQPPAELDYRTWLGPAPDAPYNEKHVHYNFRFFWDYSGGQMTNWGAHHFDIAQWGLGADDTGPVSVRPLSVHYHPKDHYEVFDACRAEFEYSGGVRMTVGQGEKDIPFGTTFIGTEGRLFVDRGKTVTTPEDLYETPLDSDDVRLTESDSHHGNFLDCVRSGARPICDVEIGHRSATVCHLANIALRTGKEFAWDPAAERFTGANADEGNGRLMYDYRQPWSLAGVA